MTTADTKLKLKTITVSEATYAALSEEYGGWCLACGAEASGVEPDARRRKCEECGKPAVYGAEEALVMGKVRFR